MPQLIAWREFLAAPQEDRNQAELVDSLDQGHRANSGRPRQPECGGQSTKNPKGSSLNLQLSINHTRKLPKGDKTSHRIRGNITLVILAGPGIVPIPMSTVEYVMDHGVMGRVLVPH